MIENDVYEHYLPLRSYSVKRQTINIISILLKNFTLRHCMA